MSTFPDESRISLLFDKWNIPTMQQYENCLIYLKYNQKEYHIKYPQVAPLFVSLHSPFKDKNKEKEKFTIEITILILVDSKYRKLAKGLINIYSKYFYYNHFNFEKYIYLSIYRSQLDSMLLDSPILDTERNSGKISLTAQLFDPMEKGVVIKDKKQIQETKNKIIKEFFRKVKPKKDDIAAGTHTSERYRGVVEKENWLWRKLTNGGSNSKTKGKSWSTSKDKGKKFTTSISHYRAQSNQSLQVFVNDSISDISISQGDIEEKENVLDVNKKDSLFANDFYDSLIGMPKQINGDIENQRYLYKILTRDIVGISEDYEEKVQELSDMNSVLKKEIKAINKEYFTEKEKFNSERKDWFDYNTIWKTNISVSTDKNKELKEQIMERKAEQARILKTVKKKSRENNDDFDTIIDILNIFKQLKVDINQNWTDAESERWFAWLNTRELNTKYIQEELLTNNDDKIIEVIEEIVNRNYHLKKIPRIWIEQMDETQYKFNDKEVQLKLINVGNVWKWQCECNGIENEFEKWILKEFGIKNNKESSSNCNSGSTKKQGLKKGNGSTVKKISA